MNSTKWYLLAKCNSSYGRTYRRQRCNENREFIVDKIRNSSFLHIISTKNGISELDSHNLEFATSPRAIQMGIGPASKVVFALCFQKAGLFFTRHDCYRTETSKVSFSQESPPFPIHTLLINNNKGRPFEFKWHPK